MIIVLDTSAAIEIILNRKSSELFAEKIRQAEWVISPSLFISEVTNVFWKYQKFANYSYADCEKNIEQAIAIPDDYINDLELYREAFNMSCMLDHPVYDMLYLILARRNNALLLTMDKKLSTAAQKCNIKT